MGNTDHSFAPIGLFTLRPKTGYAKPYSFSPNPVKVSSSALEVLTDLRFVPAATVKADLDIESTMQKMIARGVRSLLVVDAEDDVIGLVTARDLMGERPTATMISSNLEYSEIKVCQVMTIADHIEVLPLEDVLHAHVGDIVETLKHSGRQHAMVVDEDAITGKALIRGIFSASQIARQLGVVLQKHDLSQTFAEIDQAMKRQMTR